MDGCDMHTVITITSCLPSHQATFAPYTQFAMATLTTVGISRLSLKLYIYNFMCLILTPVLWLRYTS